MNNPTIKKSKWFWAWQDYKEEEWLGQMAKQGLHLVRVATFGRYTFTNGKPRDEVYQLDFVVSNKKDETYFQLFRDAGWEHAGEMGGWQYWHKEVKGDETPKIFTDRESKAQKYQRLLGFLCILFLPIFLAVINMRNSIPYLLSWENWLGWTIAGIVLLILPFFFLYIYIIVRIGMRIHQLKQQ